jgi:AraC-type transcriptional regulator N-terminus
MPMLGDLRREIARLMARRPGALPAEGATVSAADRTTPPLGHVARPALALVVQDVKRLLAAERVFDYRAGQDIVAVDAPVTTQSGRASITESFLAFGLAPRPSVVAGFPLEAPRRRARQDSEPTSS